jgi:hypothetical protein
MSLIFWFKISTIILVSNQSEDKKFKIKIIKIMFIIFILNLADETSSIESFNQDVIFSK